MNENPRLNVLLCIVAQISYETDPTLYIYIPKQRANLSSSSLLTRSAVFETVVIAHCPGREIASPERPPTVCPAPTGIIPSTPQTTVSATESAADGRHGLSWMYFFTENLNTNTNTDTVTDTVTVTCSGATSTAASGSNAHIR